MPLPSIARFRQRNVLDSLRAVELGVYVVRAFVKLRKLFIPPTTLKRAELMPTPGFQSSTVSTRAADSARHF